MSALVSNGAPSAPGLLPSLPHAVWRADQMACYRAAATSSGYPLLNAELPNGGWPASALIELLLQQSGIGEMHLLKPALAAIARQRRVVLLQPPHWPQFAAWAAWGLPAERLLWIKPGRSADALWSAEQILRNGSCGALLFWQTQVRAESLRRLHLAAQGSEITFWMMRPLTAAQDASPAPLRLGLRPAHGGVRIDILKRRGPQRTEALHLMLPDLPAASSNLTSSSNHALMDRRALAAIGSRSLSPVLV